MTTQTFSTLFALAALSLGSTARAQSMDSLDITISTSVGTSCYLRTLPSDSREVRGELRTLQSEADRAMCLSDGVVFATDLEGEVRVSVLAPMADGALGITDHFLTSDDIAGLSSISAPWPAPLPYPNTGTGLHEDCDAGPSVASGSGEINGGVAGFFDIWTEIRIGGQEGEPFRAVLDALIVLSDATESMYIDDASSNYADRCGNPDSSSDASSRAAACGMWSGGDFQLTTLGDDTQLANVDLQSCTAGVLPVLFEAAYKTIIPCLNQVGDDAQLANLDLQSCIVAQRRALANETYDRR